MGQGFAFLGFSPFFIGKIAVVAAVVIFSRTGCLTAFLTTLPTAYDAVAILANAMFDVVPEGPMQGIGFWCLF